MNEEFVKLALYGNHYMYEDANTVRISILGCFLTSDVGCYWPSYKIWALDNDAYPALGGNITNLEKEDNYIIVSDQLSEQSDGGPYFKIKKEEFIRLLDMWEKVCKQKPQEILITYDGQKFEIETK